MTNHAVILAGGTGTRMGDVKLPKQFLEICSTPIIIMTLKKIIETNLFDTISIVIHKDWEIYLKELLTNFSLDNKEINIIPGGQERLDSIENSVDYLKKLQAKDDDIVVICDAVRPFVSEELLKNAVEETKKYGATVAVYPVKDTMIMSKDGLAIEIPERQLLFHGQTPDSSKFKLLYESIKSLTPQERKMVTGTVQICKIKGIPVHTFKGDEKNIKITTIRDLYLGNAIYKEEFRK